jgi:hypothetical protein
MTKQDPILAEIRSLKLSSSADTIMIIGKVRAMYLDVQNERPDLTAHNIQKKSATDLLELAEQLLKEGKSGDYGHVPAAVLAGAILENSIRGICERVGIDLYHRGKNKPLNKLIEELQVEGIYNKIQAHTLAGCKKIRNQAAHGEFNYDNVVQMIKDIKDLVETYM